MFTLNSLSKELRFFSYLSVMLLHQWKESNTLFICNWFKTKTKCSFRISNCGAGAAGFQKHLIALLYQFFENEELNLKIDLAEKNFYWSTVEMEYSGRSSKYRHYIVLRFFFLMLPLRQIINIPEKGL